MENKLSAFSSGKRRLGEGHDSCVKIFTGLLGRGKRKLFCELQMTEVGFHGKQIFPASEREITLK